MTEPSKEAEAWSDWFVWVCPSCAEQLEYGPDGELVEPCNHVSDCLDCKRVQVGPISEVPKELRERWEKETRERLEAAGLKDLLFQEAIKHLSFESPEDQEEYVWGLVNGVVSTILDAIFDKGEGDG